MTEILRIDPIRKVSGPVTLPGSKSISNRALLLSALSAGRTELKNLLAAEDTEMMIGALGKLGVRAHLSDKGTTAVIDGVSGSFPVKEAELFLGNAGTAMRPLTSVLAFSGGKYVLDGVARMRERPIKDLVEALNSLGAKIEYSGAHGFPPLKIFPAEGLKTDTVHIKGEVSSQFVSGLLMAAPLIAPGQGLRVIVDGALISSPYVALTLRLMEKFGVCVRRTGPEFLVPKASYVSPGHFDIEPDASSASYFLALGALRGPLEVKGISKESIQGDAAFADYLEKMGATVLRNKNSLTVSPPESGELCGISCDVSDIPDAAMTLAAIAPMCKGPMLLKGIGSWKVKETDRISAMRHELLKTGAAVEAGDDYIRITPPERLSAQAVFDTYKDHRMAMCMSLLGASGMSVEIRDPACVAKTFPDYFERLARVSSRAES